MATLLHTRCTEFDTRFLRTSIQVYHMCCSQLHEKSVARPPPPSSLTALHLNPLMLKLQECGQLDLLIELLIELLIDVDDLIRIRGCTFRPAAQFETVIYKFIETLICDRRLTSLTSTAGSSSKIMQHIYFNYHLLQSMVT